MFCDVVLIGTLCPDILMYAEQGQKIIPGREIFVPYMQIRAGGPSSYPAIAMAKLGLHCCPIDKIGSDIFGDFMLKELERFGVDTKYIEISSDEKTSVTIAISTRSEQDTMVAYPGPNRKLSVNSMISSLKRAPAAKLLHVAAYPFSNYLRHFKNENISRFFQYAKKRGVLISLDPNQHHPENCPKDEVEKFLGVLKYVDVLLLNLNEGKMVAGEKSPAKIVSSLLKLGPKVVALKLGKEGSCVGSQEENVQKVSSFKVEVVDTTGAGDVFDGAFIYGLLKGWKLREIANSANTAAALYISQSKIDKKFPSAQDIHNFLKRERTVF